MSPPLLEKILRFCIKNKNITFKLDDIIKDPDFKYESEKEIANELKIANCFFIFKQTNDGQVIKIDIDIKICEYYNQNRCGPICYKLHVCKNAIISECNESKCKLEHDFLSKFNLNLFIRDRVNIDTNTLFEFYRVIFTLILYENEWLFSNFIF